MGPAKRRRLSRPQPNERNVSCANCSCVHGEDGKKIKIFREIPVNLDQDTRQQQQEEEDEKLMKVYDVLSSIFKLNYLDQLRFWDKIEIEQVDGQKFLLHCDNNTLEEDEENSENDNMKDIGLCEPCAKNLTYLYNFHQQFTPIGRLDSYLSKKITKLNQIVHHLNEISHKTTTSSSSSNHLPSEKDDNNFDCQDDDESGPLETFEDIIKVESSTDKDRDENSVDPFVVNETVTDDGDDDGSSKINQTNATQNPALNQKLHPVVHLCALTKEEIQAATRYIPIVSQCSSKHTNFITEDILIDDLHSSDEELKGTQQMANKDDQDLPMTTVKRKRRRATTKINTMYCSNDSDNGSDWHNIDNDDDDDEDFVVQHGAAESITSKRRCRQDVKKGSFSKEIVSADDDDNRQEETDADINCGICHQSFHSPLSRFKHMLVHLPEGWTDNSILPCPGPKCKRKYNNKYSMLQHLRSHHCPNHGGYTCPAEGCSKYFDKNDHNLLDLHLKSHWPDNEYFCPNCLERCLSTEDYEDHQAISCIHSSGRFTCPSTSSCPDKIFKSESQLTKHIQMDHPGEKMYECTFPLCTTTFQLFEYLRRHVEINHTKTRTVASLDCPKNCGRKYRDEVTLETHVQTCTGEQIFWCTVCNRKLATNFGLKMHLKSHGEKQKLVCKVEGCGKVFTSRSGYKDHANLHDTSKHYVCEQCGKVTTKKQNYNSHLKIHSEEKTHLCSLCGKSFLRHQGLQKHLASHSQDKPHECAVCHKFFKHTDALGFHVRTVHGISSRKVVPEIGTVVMQESSKNFVQEETSER